MAVDQQQHAPKLPPITPNDVIGIIRQSLLELMGVLNQPVSQIDPILVNAYLIRMLEFNDVLPRMPEGENTGRHN